MYEKSLLSSIDVLPMSEKHDPYGFLFFFIWVGSWTNKAMNRWINSWWEKMAKSMAKTNCGIEWMNPWSSKCTTDWRNAWVYDVFLELWKNACKWSTSALTERLNGWNMRKEGVAMKWNKLMKGGTMQTIECSEPEMEWISWWALKNNHLYHNIIHIHN